jgi:hypothetical protein
VFGGSGHNLRIHARINGERHKCSATSVASDRISLLISRNKTKIYLCDHTTQQTCNSIGNFSFTRAIIPRNCPTPRFPLMK